jgi:hypothetical protein
MAYKGCSEADEWKLCTVIGVPSQRGYLYIEETRTMGVLVEKDGKSYVDFKSSDDNKFRKLRYYAVVGNNSHHKFKLSIP